MLKKSEILIESLGSQTAELFYGAAPEASVRIVDTLPSTQKLTVRNAYYTSLRGVWFLAQGLAAAGLLIILFVRVKELSRVHEQIKTGLEAIQSSIEGRTLEATNQGEP
jgi:hypothetical protein